MKTAETTELELPSLHPQEVIHLPLGLLGFEQIKDYVWLEAEEELPFRWIQALGDPSLTFLVVPPFDIHPDYQPNISNDDVGFLGLREPTDALIFSIVTLRPHGRSTANLRGPVILNRFTRRGKQVVLANATEYALQHPLPE